MKQFFLLIFVVFSISFSYAAPITTWQGPSTGGSWSDAANWDNGVPTTATTEIVFDGAAGSLTGGVITITNVIQSNSNFSYDRLSVINNATVNLSSNLATYFYFYLSINIEQGSTLNVGGNTGTLFLIGGALFTVTNIDGTLNLQGQGTGNSSRTGFEPTNVSFGSTAKATVRGLLILSGKVAVVSLSTPANFIVENGGTFNVTRDGGTVPNGNYKNGSLIKVQGVVNASTNFVSATYDGVIEWNNPGQLVGGSSAILLPSSSFNSFDSLVINNTNTGTVRLATNPSGYLVKNIIMNSGRLEFGSPTGSGNYTCNVDTIIQNGGTLIGNAAGVVGFDNAYNPDTINIRGKFLQNGGVFDLSNRTPNNISPDASCILNITGDLIIGGTVRLSQPTTAPNCAIAFGGTTSQLFSVIGSGAYLNKIKTVINNASPTTGISLASNVTLPDSLLFKNGYFILNNFDLTNPLPVAPVTNPFQTHVITNGTGLFIQKNVSVLPVGIPIGGSTTAVNPLIVALAGAGLADIGFSVVNTITPAVVAPNITVNRTWLVKPIGAALPANLGISFGYSDLGVGLGDGNSSFSYTANNEVGLYTGLNWQVISLPGGIAPGGTNPYAVTHVILNTLLAPNVATPLVVGNVASVLSVANIINLSTSKSGNTAVLKWDVTELTAAVSRFEILRSNDGRNFNSIGNTPVIGNQAYYSFIDNSLLQGVNYYRIKMIDFSGQIRYSVIAAVINKSTGVVLTSIIPTTVSNQATLMVSSTSAGSMQFTIMDMQGRIIKKITSSIYPGSNEVTFDCTNLATGTYQITGYTQGDKTNVIRFVKQ